MSNRVSMHPREEERSIGELFSLLSEQTSRLVRDEIRLAQAELRQQGKVAAMGAGMLGGAGAAALLGMAAFCAAGAIALTLVIPDWAAALVVGGLLMGFGGTAGLLGKVTLGRAMPPTPTQAIDSTKRDLQAVREGVRS